MGDYFRDEPGDVQRTRPTSFGPTLSERRYAVACPTTAREAPPDCYCSFGYDGVTDSIVKMGDRRAFDRWLAGQDRVEITAAEAAAYI